MKPLAIDPHLTPDLVDLLAVSSLNGDTRLDESVAGEAQASAHLDRCEQCQAAVADRSAVLLLDREAVDALVDAQLTDAALDAQQRAIAARLAQRDNIRVLEFPARAAKPARRDRPAARWLAAAAAAGLFVGVITGPRLETALGILRPHPPILGVKTPPVEEPESYEARIPHARDEAFLSELETAVNNRGAAPLRALDDLTPEPMPASVRTPR